MLLVVLHISQGVTTQHATTEANLQPQKIDEPVSIDSSVKTNLSKTDLEPHVQQYKSSFELLHHHCAVVTNLNF